MITAESCTALERLIAEHYNGGMGRLQKRCRAFAADNDGWAEILRTDDQAQFDRRITALANWVSRSRYQAMRLEQLSAGQYECWVYRSCACDQHTALDGVAMPPVHRFWTSHFPSNGWGCGCEVYGTNTIAGIRRMGGDPDKALPEGWDIADPRTGELPWLEAEFSGQVHPDFMACLSALRRGVHDSLY